MKHRITAVLLPLLCAVTVLISLLVLLPAEAEENRPLSPKPFALADEPLECTGSNLLTNPSFEGDYPVYVMDAPGHPDCQTDPNHLDQPNQYCERARLAIGWHPFWRDNPRPEPWINIQPEFKPAYTWDRPPRVRSGERGQQYFSFYSSHEGGIYQQITAVPGGQYCFSVWGHAWSANTSNSDYTSTDDHGNLHQKIGIDPTGGTDLDVVLTSAGLLTGTYTNTLTISADGTIGGPALVPLKIVVVDEIWQVYLPTALKP